MSCVQDTTRKRLNFTSLLKLNFLLNILILKFQMFLSYISFTMLGNSLNYKWKSLFIKFGVIGMTLNNDGVKQGCVS